MGHHSSTYGLLFIHLVGALSIAIAGGLGASAQLITELHGRQNETVAYYKRWLKMILTALGAGVVVATALLHILPDGMSSLEEAGISSYRIDNNNNPLQHQHGLFYTGIAKMHQSMIGHQTIDNLGGDGSVAGDGSIAVDCVHMKKKKRHSNTHSSPSGGTTATTTTTTSPPCRRYKRPPGGVSGVGLVLLLLGFIVTYIVETEVHAVVSKAKSETIKTHIMEAGIATHSLLVGVAFGTLSSIEGAKGLAIALTVHQLCEGFAMGPVIYQGAHTFLHAVVLIAIFALSTPIGVVIGVFSTYGSGDSSGGDTMGESANFAQGVLSCVASGLLLYVGLVEFLGGLLCTVHQDSWSHAVAGGDTDHVDHHPSQYHPTHKEGDDDDDDGNNNNKHTGEKRGLLLSPPPRHLDGVSDNVVTGYGSCAPSSTTTKCDDDDDDGLDDVPMVPIVPNLPPTINTTLERPCSPKPACSSRGRFLQTLPAGASFPRLQTPTLRPKPAPYYFALDESISLVGLSIASSPLMYSCSGGQCVQQSPSSSLRGGTSFAAALEGGGSGGDAIAASSAGCCSTDCSPTQEHEHQHHHSHSGHQQRHHHHASSCGHVADFHCAHPHLARFAVSGMVAMGAAIMALLALIT